jgi:WD40 repeat protein
LLPPKFETLLLPRARNFALHDVATGRVTELPEIDSEDQNVRAILAVSADGKRAVVTSTGSAYLFVEIATGKVLLTVPSRCIAYQRGVSLSPDGKLLAYCDARQEPLPERKYEAVVWDVDKNAEVMRVAVLQNAGASAILSADGKTLATFGNHQELRPNQPEDTVSPSRIVQLWDVATGKQRASLHDPRDLSAIRNAAFSPDGKMIVTVCGKGYMALWSAADGKLIEEPVCRTTQGERFAFAPDGKTLAAIDQYGVIERWALPGCRPLKTTECPVPSARWTTGRGRVRPTDLVFTDSERLVASGEVWVRTVVWNAPGGKLLTPVPEHVSGIEALQFTADGREIVTALQEGRILRWEVGTGKVLARTNVETGDDDHAREAPVALAPGGKFGLRAAIVIDPARGTETFRLPATHAVPSPDFTHALALRWRHDPTARTTPGTIWNLETGKRLSTIELKGWISNPDTRLGMFAVAFSPDNSRLVTLVEIPHDPVRPRLAFLITGWETKTGKRLGEFELPASLHGTEIAAAANNSGAVFASRDGKLWVVDYEKGARGDVIDELPRGAWFSRPTFSPDGKFLAVGAPIENTHRSGVRIYSWPRGQLLHTFSGQPGAVTALAFSADGKVLVSGSSEGTALVWDLTVVGKPK